MRRLLFAVVLAVLLAAAARASETLFHVLTCTVEAESTTNNQAGIAYFACGPNVSIMAVPGSIPELRLRALVGKTVDLKMSEVQP